MIKRLIIIATVIGLLVSCPDPTNNSSGNSPKNPDNPNNPNNPQQNTTIVFDNTQGICAVAVYDSYQRREQDKIIEVPAGQLSAEIEWTPGDLVPFYFLYRINLKGINGFTLDYVPKEIGKDQTSVRVDANTKTTIGIHKLNETVSSPNDLLSEKSYLLIQNNSSFSFRLLRGTSILTPESSSSSLVNSEERAKYTINPGAASPYQLLVGADYKQFSGSIVSFEAGHVYSFIFDGNVSLIAEVEIILENVAQTNARPETPGAPAVTASDGLLTLRWIAIHGAESYEVYASTTQNPPALPAKTVAGTTTVLTGLTNKSSYYIWIKAVNNSGSSDYSPFSRGIPWPTNEKPATPGRPVIIPGINQLTVNWDECGGAASYEVYINTTPSSPSAPGITTEKTSAVINNLDNDKIYYIWIKAVNRAGKSDYSPIEAGTLTIPTKAPAAPTRPILTVGSHKLTVSWQAVELAAAYEIWLGTTDNSAQAKKQGGDITGSITETVITGLVNETIYYVWIKAKNVVGTSGFSPAANAKPSAFAVLPEIPSVPSVTAGNRELNVNWQSVEGALSYEVWTGTTNNSTTAQKNGADVSGTSVTLTGLTNDTTYYIWIKAKNNIGVSDLSLRASGTPSAFAATPSAPQNAPTIIAGSGQLTVSWSAAEGANVYEVWAGTDTNPTLATKRGGDVTGLSSVITGLTNGTAYYVWIKAKNDVGISGFSPMTTGMPQEINVSGKTPATPVVNIGNEQIILTWQAMEGATVYEVWLGTVNNSASATKNGTDVTASLSVTINGLTNGSTYYVWIKAKNNISTSGFSSAASGKPIANASAPILSASNGQLSVTWAAIAGADQYDIFCGTGINPPQSAAQTINAPATSASITGLVNGTTYHVWIKGKNTTGTGTISEMADAKPVGNMGTVTVSTGNGQLTASWSAVAGADQYEVYYSNANSIPASPSQTVSTTTVTINGLTNGTTYYLWIKGKNANGAGNVSVAISCRLVGTPEAPTVSPAYKQLLVTWTTVPNADEYEVYYGTSTPTLLVATTTETTATISGLTNGTTYYVRLRAKNADGISDYGPSASGVPNSDMLTPGLYRGAEKIGTQNLTDSLTYISANAVSGDDYYIVLGTNESVSPKTLSYSGKTVGITLLGYGDERRITLNSNGNLFDIESNVTLTLDENITLMGRSQNNDSLVFIQSGGKLIMNDSTKITNNTNYQSTANDSCGGGVYVNRYGIFIMNGGTISSNTANGSRYAHGGGVYSWGTFIMNDGTISGNTANGRGDYARGGGVFSTPGATFNMNGGTISGNTVISNASNDNESRGGGGVYGGIKKSGGTITGYASDKVNGNVVKKNSGVVQNNQGHAVLSIGNRETTAGPTVNLDSSKSGSAGGWE